MAQMPNRILSGGQFGISSSDLAAGIGIVAFLLFFPGFMPGIVLDDREDDAGPDDDESFRGESDFKLEDDDMIDREAYPAMKPRVVVQQRLWQQQEQ